MILAAGWSDTAVAIVAAAFIFMAIMVAIWQIFATVRARMSVAREQAYRKLAEDATQAQERTANALEKTVAELAELRRQTNELDRVLKEVG